MRKVCTCFIIFLCAALFLCGCNYNKISTQREEPKYSIAVVTRANNSPYWMAIEKGANAAAEENNVNLIYLYPSGEGEVEEQKQIINDLLETDIDALLFSPCDIADTAWIKEKAREKLLLMNIDDKSLDIDLPFVGSDHYKMGEDAADYFEELFPDGGNICILLGPINQKSGQDRLKGLINHLDKPLELSEIKFTSMTQMSAYNTIMGMDEKIDGIFCHNIVLAQGAVIALKEKGWDAKIITVDTPESGEHMMERGIVDAVVEQDGYVIGYQAVISALQNLETGEEIKDIKIVSKLMTPSGVWEGSE